MADASTLIDRAFGPGAGKKAGEIGSTISRAFKGAVTHDPTKKEYSVDTGSNQFTRPLQSTTAPVPARAGVPQGSLPKPSAPTPGISPARMNSGGGPGLESPGSGAVRNMMDHEMAQLFAKPGTQQPGGPMPYNGAFAQGGAFGPGGKFAPGTPGGKVMADPNFTGVPTMQPAQASVGNDIFGDTADLFKKRDMLRSQRDAFFAKNPLSPNDIGGNFAKAATMSGNRRDIEALDKTLQQREQIMGNLAGIMMGGQLDIQKQGVANAGQLQSTQTAGQLDIQKQGVANAGQLQNTQVAGQFDMLRQGLANKGMDTAARTAGELDIQRQRVADEGANSRSAAEIQKDRDLAGSGTELSKQLMTMFTEINKTLAGTDVDEGHREKMNALLDIMQPYVYGVNGQGRQMPFKK